MNKVPMYKLSRRITCALCCMPLQGQVSAQGLSLLIWALGTAGVRPRSAWLSTYYNQVGHTRARESGARRAGTGGLGLWQGLEEGREMLRLWLISGPQPQCLNSTDSMPNRWSPGWATWTPRAWPTCSGEGSGLVSCDSLTWQAMFFTK